MRRALFHLVMLVLFVPYVCASFLATLAAKFVHFHDRVERDMEDWSEGWHERMARDLGTRLRAAHAQLKRHTTRPLTPPQRKIRWEDTIDDFPREDDL